MPESNPFDERTLRIGAEEAEQAIQQAGDKVNDLIDAWVRSGNAAAVQEVADHGAGQARKAARRGLNILKSRGVPIPERRRKAASGSSASATTEAFLMAPDASGAALIAIYRTLPSGRCNACFVHMNDEFGILRVERFDATSGKVKAALTRGYAGWGYKPVPVPLPWARAKVARARARHRERKVPEPLGFTNTESLLEPIVDPPPDHPFDSEGFVFDPDDAKVMSSESGALHHLPEFRSWLPSQEAVREMLRKVGERLSGQDKPEQEQVADHLKEGMLEATDRYFTPEVREVLVRRMKDAGISVLNRAGEAEALKVAATIQVIQECGLVTDPPREVPFLRAFFEKAISFLMAQQGGKLDIPVPNQRPLSAVEGEAPAADAANVDSAAPIST